MDKWLKIRRHDLKEPLQISQPAKFLIAWDQALRWKGGGGGGDEEESKLGVGEKKNDHRLARLAHRYFPIWPRFLPFPPKGLKKPWKGLFNDLTVALKGYLTAVIHDSQNDGDK